MAKIFNIFSKKDAYQKWIGKIFKYVLHIAYIIDRERFRWEPPDTMAYFSKHMACVKQQTHSVSIIAYNAIITHKEDFTLDMFDILHIAALFKETIPTARLPQSQQ